MPRISNQPAISKINLLFLLIIFILTSIVQPAFAGPANPELLTLTNPDGTSFKARVRGDEFQNWTETDNGYSVVRNPVSKYWEYAEKAADGTLRNSGVVFKPDTSPLPKTPKGLRPDRNTKAESYLNKLIKEIYQERQAPMNSVGTESAPAASSPEAAAGDWVPAPVSGARKMLIVLINFADRTLVTTPSGWYSKIFDTSSGAKSMANYYSQNSYGMLNISPAPHTQPGNPAGIITVTIADNHPNFGGNANYTTETTILAHALAQASQYINFASYDTDNDGTLEQSELSIYFIYAGYEASGSDKTPSIWAHAWGGTPGIPAGSKYINRWAQNGELNNYDAQHPMGVIAHEMGHALCGLPDLYDTSYTNGGLGIFSLMAGGSWGADTGEYSGTTPVGLDAWSRQYLEWSTPVVPSGNGTLSLPLPLSSPASSYKWVDTSITDTEYFLAENRYPSGWDLGMKTVMGSSWQGGLLILHVDTTSGTQGMNDINEYGASAHQGVMPEEASTATCSILSSSQCWGSAGTLFYSGNNNAFTDLSTPNSKYYSGDSSGFAVTSISTPGQPMSAVYAFTALPPSIRSNTPPDNSSGVSRGTTVSVTFSKDIDQSTLSSSTLYLEQGSNKVSGTISYNSSTHTATFTPSTYLAANTTFTATVTSGIKGHDGSALAEGKSWNFTTGTMVTISFLSNGDFEGGSTGWSAAQVSGTGAWTFESIGSNPTVSPHGGTKMAKFNSYDTISGTQTRFYQTEGFAISSTYSTVTLNFWMYHDTGYSSYADQVQVQVSTDGSTWTNFSSPINRYNGTTGWSQTSLDLSSYRGNSNFRIGFLGISKYGNNIFLDDVAVTATVPADTTPPTVTSTSPATGATGIAVTTPVTATFSEDMDAATINSSTFTVNNGATGTVSYNAATRTATLTPSASLASGTVYTATITVGVKDAAGNPMAAAKTWSFTTTASRTLSVTFGGTGSGSVNSSPAGIACATGNSGTSSYQFASGTSVTLIPTASGDSLFNGWTGTCTGTSGNDCIVTIDSDKSFIANFRKILPVMIQGGSDFSSFQTACDSKTNSAFTIKAQDAVLTGDFSVGGNNMVKLEGGYNSDYSSNSGGVTTIDGILTLVNGSLTVENLAIK